MNKYMDVALKEAHLALEAGEVPVGAAIFKGDVLVASAHNETEKRQDPTAHAEMLAMKRAREKLGTKYLMGLSLYVTLEPCAMCRGAAALYKLDRIYFGAYDAKSGVCGGKTDLTVSDVFDYKTEVYGSIDEPECEALLKSFFQSVRKEHRHGREQL